MMKLGALTPTQSRRRIAILVLLALTILGGALGLHALGQAAEGVKLNWTAMAPWAVCLLGLTSVFVLALLDIRELKEHYRRERAKIMESMLEDLQRGKNAG